MREFAMLKLISTVDTVKSSARKLFVREEGATMVEYGLMVALIAIVVIAAVTAIGGNLNGLFSKVAASTAPTT